MVYQNLSNDCGFACLKMICNHYGYPFDMDRAKEKYWNANGINLLDFKALAATHDFKTSAFAITHAENLAMKSPFILVESTNQINHAVVCFGYSPTAKELIIADPAKGWKFISISDGLRQYKYLLKLEPEFSSAKSIKSKNPFLVFFLRLFHPYKSTYLRLLFLSFLTGLLAALSSYLIQQLIDQNNISKTIPSSVSVILLVILALFAKTGIEWCYQSIWLNYQQKICNNYFPLLFKRMMNFHPKLLFNMNNGETLAILNDLKSALNGHYMLMQFMLSDVFLLLFYLFLCAYYSIPIALVILLFSLVPAIIVYLKSPAIIHSFEESRSTQINADNSFLAFSKVLSYGHQILQSRLLRQHVNHTYLQAFQHKNDAFLKLQSFKFILNMVMNIESGILIYILLRGYQSGSLTMGEFSVLFSTTFLLNHMIYQALKLPVAMKEYLPFTARINNILTTRVKSVETPNLPPFEMLEIKDLKINIPANPIINKSGFNFKLQKNQLLVITGSNGVGKSILLKTLLGFVTKSCGEIKWNNIPIDSLPNKSICGYLAQTPSLLYGTLSFNITLNENCPKAELAMFSHCFELSPFIAKFKNGWNTLFTAEQDELSFGEVKLIAILREFYKKPQLLILDEPTASLSIEATDYMIALLQKIKSRTTILCVSHETKLLASADQLLEIK